MRGDGEVSVPIKKRTMHRPSKDVTVPTRKVGMDARIRHQAMTVRAP